ncbi:MAG: hypothetical protein LBD42_01075 [Desulfovibrio sp.]|nr:hypothetical protein [Desulfovibrio sp.]
MRTWVHHNHAAFERDVLEDFCQSVLLLSEQFSRFAATQTLSFSVLRNMVGEPFNKGLLWRLKDKAHHVFLNAREVKPAGILLNWSLGYIFHESFKLMEDAYQRQYYAPQLGGLMDAGNCPELAALMRDLLAVQSQTVESMRREVARLNTLICQSRKLFCLYFAGCADHRHLARFLHDSNDLAHAIFKDDYHRLIQAIYGNEPERMYLEAAHSLLASARFYAAGKAVAAILADSPRHPDALTLQEIINSQKAKENFDDLRR